MSDLRELRLSLEKKLNNRRDLLAKNIAMRKSLENSEDRNNFLLKTLANPLVNYALEDCSDQIVNEILIRAIEASKVIAEKTLDGGDYVIGMDIPSLQIRHRLRRQEIREADLFEQVEYDRPVTKIYHRRRANEETE